MPKFIKQVGGAFQEEATVSTSAGASSASKVPELDANGKLDLTMMPSSIGAEIASAITSEALVAGNFVNIYNNAGTPTCRKADASNNRPAHGFVKAGFANAATATVYLEGLNDQVTGQTAGAVFLGTSGAAVSTAPSTSNYIVQEIGVAVSATAISFSYSKPILLA